MDVIQHLIGRGLLALGEEKTLEAVAQTLSLPMDRADARSMTNTWYFPLPDAGERWEERVTVWTEPPGAEPTKLRVGHSIVLPKDLPIEKGLVVGLQPLLDAWNAHLKGAFGAATKVGTARGYAREGLPTVVVGRARLGTSKVWHTMSTDLDLLPRR